MLLTKNQDTGGGGRSEKECKGKKNGKHAIILLLFDITLKTVSESGNVGSSNSKGMVEIKLKF